MPVYNFTTPDYGINSMGYIQFYEDGGCHGGGTAVTAASPESYNGTQACATTDLMGNGESFTIGGPSGGSSEGVLGKNCQINLYSQDDCAESSWIGYIPGGAQAPTCNYPLLADLTRIPEGDAQSFNMWCNQ